MIEAIAAAIIGGALALGAAFAYGRVEYWKGMYETSSADIDKALDRVAKTEKTAQAVADKFTMLTDIVQQQMERPIVAALSDAHVEKIAQTLAVLTAHSMNPNRLN